MVKNKPLCPVTLFVDSQVSDRCPWATCFSFCRKRIFVPTYYPIFCSFFFRLCSANTAVQETYMTLLRKRLDAASKFSKIIINNIEKLRKHDYVKGIFCAVKNENVQFKHLTSFL